jgi:hypothetical protein
MTAKPSTPSAPPKSKPATRSRKTDMLPTLIEAANASLRRAAEAAKSDETAKGDAAWRLGDHLYKTAKELGWIPPPPSAEVLDLPAGDDLLARIEQALELGRRGMRIEVTLLRNQGIDPRQGWRWDGEAGDWFWDAGRALQEDAALKQRDAQTARDGLGFGSLDEA